MKKFLFFAVLLCALSSCETPSQRDKRIKEMVEKENAQWNQRQKDIYHQSDSLMKVIGGKRY